MIFLSRAAQLYAANHITCDIVACVALERLVVYGGTTNARPVLLVIHNGPCGTSYEPDRWMTHTFGAGVQSVSVVMLLIALVGGVASASACVG